MDEIKKHPQYSYDMVKDKYVVPAEIALRHHMFKSDFYPKNLPRPNIIHGFIDGLNQYAMMLSLVDIYDALKSRAPYREGKSKLEKSEVKNIMIGETPKLSSWITRFYSAGFFQ